jgi:hypothetical protein
MAYNRTKSRNLDGFIKPPRHNLDGLRTGPKARTLTPAQLNELIHTNFKS